MYLVDTSVWIDYVRDREGPHVGFLEEILSNPQAVAISPLIYMEILQGARDVRSFKRLEKFLGGQRFVDFEQPPPTCHAAAARIAFDCKKRGITVRSSVDCLIAQCAIENDLTLFHHDRDFQRIAGVVPKLREKSFLN